MYRSILVFLFALGLSQPALTAEGGPHNVGPELPAKLRKLLVQEMNAILDASKTIQDALVRGESETVAKKAQQIHDSFILKQKMTPADRKALKAAVPKAFIKRDQAFHKLSGQLADAARKGQQDRQERLFTKMVRACAGCHKRHALGRFPGLE